MIKTVSKGNNVTLYNYDNKGFIYHAYIVDKAYVHVLELITLKNTQSWKECVTGRGFQSHIPMQYLSYHQELKICNVESEM